MPIYVPYTLVASLAGNTSFDQIEIEAGTISSGTLSLNLIGNNSSMSYVFPYAFTVGAGGTMAVGANVQVLLNSQSTFSDAGTVTFSSGDQVTLTYTDLSVSGNLTANGADFIVQGNVHMVPIPGNQQRVEIQWSVKKPDGDERGKVVQLNEIPAGSLDHYWADVALVVATEAAGGVNDVITRQSGREPGEPVHGQAQKPLVEGRKSGVEPVR